MLKLLHTRMTTQLLWVGGVTAHEAALCPCTHHDAGRLGFCHLFPCLDPVLGHGRDLDHYHYHHHHHHQVARYCYCFCYC